MIEFFTNLGEMFGAWLNAGFWLVAIFVALAALAGLGTLMKGSKKEDSKIRSVDGLKTLSKKTCVVRSVAHNRRASGATASGKPVAVIRFDGDVMASQRNDLALLINEIIFNKERIDSVIAVVNSPGGAVPHYGQAYAEMERIRKAGIHLTVCVDTAAASGGYLMSVPANKIVAAPFAYVASIGVVAQVLNYFNLLKRAGIEPMIFTAGEYKRTVTATGEVDDEAKEHFKAQLAAIHAAFKAVVSKYRPNVNVEKVFTGEHWTAQESVDQELGLVDEIATSAEYLFGVNDDKDLVTISIKANPKSQLLSLMSMSIDLVVEKVTARLSSNGING